jgi:tetratricopeptide (TPR) repeat protein
MEKYYHVLILIAIIFVCSQPLIAQSQEVTDILGKSSSAVITLVAWDSKKNIVGEGTGFAIAENLIVIPYHLISQAAEAEITTISSKKAKVEALMAVDRNFNLAILRIKGKVDPLTLGTAQKLKKGDRLFALSEINGQVIITDGTLRNWLEFLPGDIRLMDISINLEKPAGGAPLFDLQGKVVGIAMVLGQGLKFGVPIEPILALNRLAKGKELNAATKENYLETAEGAYFTGKSAALLSEPGMATLYLEKYVNFRPDSLEAYLLLGDAYYRLDNYSDSYNNYTKALLLKKDNPQALYGLGLNLIKQKRYKEAIEQLEKAIANKVDSKEIYFTLASAYEELQELNKAAENYLQYIQTEPPNVWISWRNLAQIYIKLNQTEKAIAAYREALKLRPDDISCNYNLAKLLASLEQYEEADSVYKKLIAINERDAVTYYGQIMQMYDQAGKYDQAIEAAKKIIELNPKNEVAVYNLAIMYFKLNRLNEAAQSLNDCLALKNDYTYAWYNLGLVYNKLARHQEAVESFKKYNALAPDDPNGWLNIGLEYMIMKDFEKASSYLEKSVQLKPDNAVAQYNLAITYINLNDNYSAREVLKVLQRLDKSLADRLSKLIK